MNGLESISELSNLVFVTDQLIISNDQTLLIVEGVPALERVRHLRIYGNQSLETIVGFSGLVRVGDDLRINGKAMLRKTFGFHELFTVGDDIFIEDNDAITSVRNTFGLLRYSQDDGSRDFDRLHLRDNDSLCDNEVNAVLATVALPNNRRDIRNKNGTTDICGVCGGDEDNPDACESD